MAQQQSWTEWFFGSTTPTANDTNKPGDRDQTFDQSQTQSSSTKANASQNLPYGPYIRTGRGGAGNYTWQSDVNANSTADSDIEAHNASTLTQQADMAAHIEQQDTELAMRNQQQQQQQQQQQKSNDNSNYVRMGRGYVYIDRKALEASESANVTANTSSGSISRINTASTTSTLPAYRGRGGAGNYAAAAEVNERHKAGRDELDRRAADLRRDRITEDVDKTISAPQEAWLGGQR